MSRKNMARIAAANACFAARGMDVALDPVADALTAFHGGRAMLRLGYGRMGSDLLLPPGAEDEDYPRLLDHYGENIAVHTKLYPGVEAVLDSLQADGHILAVCTNKPERAARLLLEALGLMERFAALGGGDSFPVRKPDPAHVLATLQAAGGDAARAVMVGDHHNDVASGTAAGLPAIFCGWGYGLPNMAGSAPTASRPDELPELLDAALAGVPFTSSR